MVKKDYLVGKLLVSMPQIGDPRFDKSVILICAHDENGAMGLVINNMMNNVEFADLVKQLDIYPDDPDKQVTNIPVYEGGPVDTARGFVLHEATSKRDDSIEVNSEFCITGTIDAVRDIVSGKGPDNMLFILGYAGWSAGQLEKELQENTWLTANPDNNLIFNISANDKWEKAISSIGLDLSALSLDAGHA